MNLSNGRENRPDDRVRARSSRYTTERFERWQKRRFDLESKRVWQHPVEQIEPMDRSALGAVVAEWLTPVFLFLAAGNRPTACAGPIGTLHQRTWAVLYAVRPDLIDGETLADAARRFGVSEVRMSNVVREFERYIPGWRALGGGKDRHSEAHRAAIANGQLERYAQEAGREAAVA